MKRLLFAASIALWIPVGIVATRPVEQPAKVMPPRAHERPWLSADAARQVIGDDGGLGPLFDGITLGATPPTKEQREKIAAFARANDVDIKLDVKDDELVAVRFAVTYGGCCGYEGADALGRRLHRPKRESRCCDCGWDGWHDDWTVTTDYGEYARARVRVNRVEVRWERTLAPADMLERAEQLIGMTKADVRAKAGEHWVEIERGGRYRLELPFAYGYNDWAHDMGIDVLTERGRIVSVAFKLQEPVLDLARKRWGRGRNDPDSSTVTWNRNGKHIELEDAREIRIEDRAWADRVAAL